VDAAGEVPEIVAELEADLSTLWARAGDVIPLRVYRLHLLEQTAIVLVIER
jgi:hypothetical protein